MKRVYALLLAMVLLLTGCTGKGKAKDISVKDARYPYRIEHKKDTVEITFRNHTEKNIAWHTQMLSENICRVTQAAVNKENTLAYRVEGVQEGAEQLTFVAQRQDETAEFTLSLMIYVDAKGKVTAQSCQHKERKEVSQEENGLNYKWDVDVDGVLHFSFRNEDDQWSVRGGEDACALIDGMSTPSGCQFSAQANAEGKTEVLLVGETTQRQICVTLQVDGNGNLEVLSVQEK